MLVEGERLTLGQLVLISITTYFVFIFELSNNVSQKEGETYDKSPLGGRCRKENYC